MHYTDMSVLLIWLLRGVLGAPSYKDVPSYWVSKVFPKTNSVYFLSKKKHRCLLHPMNELCKTIGGYLAELDSVDEENFVAGFIKAHTKNNAFIGANDVKREGTFVYYNSKKPMPALKWLRGEPNDLNGEDCVEFKHTGLNDVKCDYISHYICELRLKRFI
ncbi:Cd209 antigen [Plakobranchus ocellatus]|uniref:Cd209 antigen n=1 Tax=Plakobranchus ocellatus TaxID=259542 RepID=A0AAV3Z395_9GAST|nr:Cd209 antigen [Plakobranchus ocellatus]